ncbi:hypothetical protein MMC28_005996 [Mycoblastus sanguinarius]|nr:hypothetical protein [Mycoblastus sanguinarius]
MSLPPANLQHLPTELLLLISQDFPPSTLLSLHYTCRRLNLFFTITIKALHSQSVIGDALEWLLFLSMLERDHCLRRQHLVCSKCFKTHHASQFSSEEQRCYPTARKCLGFEGKLWVCPHRSWTLAEVMELRKGGQLKLFHPSLWPVEPCRCLKDGLFLHTLFLHVGTSKSGMVEEKVKKALGLQRSGKCEHMRLRDPARKCFQHAGCESLGCDEAEIRCRLCIREPRTSRDDRQRRVSTMDA